ncbi:protein arginine N-methyltransferase 1-like isoform X2 [Amphibalanus amphitrite]|uniref:protein arginine N-methyltransferase 1-like isoform X2 n=1 Tax=Amphibalanus amphitrite TaxID=1232801 RepID=UPI001C925CE4|nr:protein arginine N-methyltransferase 1-like isoform X2 [Amphibalanus amphitrite]XP_043228716.1 protein arginine N-methyltransferase 1-like isoform X2 [Amphibalanus amphitrite]
MSRKLRVGDLMVKTLIFQYTNLLNMSADLEDMPDLEESAPADTASVTTVRLGDHQSPAAPPVSAGHDVAGVDSDDDDDDEAWEEMEEDCEPLPAATCLFCPLQLPASDLVAHCRSEHSLDLAGLAVRHALDSFGYIRLVNYVRSTRVTPSELDGLPAAAWADQAFMKPVVQDDPLLMIDVDDLLAAAEGGAAPPPSEPAEPVVSYEGDRVTLSTQHYEQLQRQLAALRRQLQLTEDRDEQLVKDMATMRGTMHQILRLDDEEVEQGPVSAASAAGDSASYFESYAHFGIHHEMLSDRVRTESYRDAICRNAAPCVRGRAVLDLGCGTGILSMLCARAGAAEVVGVDQSEVIYHAMDIVRENRLSDIITLVKGRLEDAKLPGGPDRKFDIIVSEWMGYFLLFEGMLDSVLYARDRLLADGGRLLPNRCTISLVAASDQERYDNLLTFWEDVYGFRMSCLRPEVLQEASVEVVPAAAVCSQPCLLKTLDINTIRVEDTEFTSPFRLRALRSCRVTALVGYFDTHFDLPVPVEFSTGPHTTPTHWKQTAFYLERPITVAEGDTIEGSLFCGRDRKDPRSLRVTITIAGKSQSYRVS